MKKLLVLAFIAFGMTTIKAQEKTNNKAASGDGFTYADIFVSGTVAFESDTNDDNNTNSNGFTFSPKIGYFLSDNIAIGLDFGYQSNKSERDIPFTNAIFKTKTTTIDVGAFARYYVNPESQFSIFGELGVGFSNFKIERGEADLKRDGLTFGFTPGINYFLSHNFALEASVGLLRYKTNTPKLDNDNNIEIVDRFNIGLDFSNINLGVVYRF